MNINLNNKYCFQMENKFIIEKITNNKGNSFFANIDLSSNILLFTENILVTINTNNVSYHETIFWLVYLIYANKKLSIEFSKFTPSEIDNMCKTDEEIKLLVNHNINSYKLKKFLMLLSPHELILSYEKVKRNYFTCGNISFVAFYGRKFNHSCNPNVNYFYNHATKILSFYTKNNVSKNEELTIDYTNLENKLNLNDIHEKLYHVYCFMCDCDKIKLVKET